MTEEKLNQLDAMCEAEVRAHAKQLEVAVKNLLYIIQCAKNELGNATSCVEILEAKQLTEGDMG